MSEKVPQGDSQASFAKRIDPKKGPLTPEQLAFIRRVELEQWKKNSQKLRGRNILTGLVIGGLVMGIYGYTFYSVSQEKFLDEMEEEAKVARMRAPKTSAN
ncbi:COA3 factor, partial [Polyodon spathula]|nr:cytochrome c oxidase assembly factor 3 homolog, mitochondrial [Polyodon spathula]MBN3275349.1 COA3 factor [Polyodon spathula]